MAKKLRAVRCAIYCRVSLSEGNGQQFTSLDMQRQICEGFVSGRKHLGWECIEERFDDDGISGGTTNRPALQRLLGLVEKKNIDCLLVYRLDRLSRSLLDFARLIDLLERKGIAFISISEQFDTSNPTGKLMLNILSSFSQYERELISSRTKDKVMAARRRGLWTGGMIPLGYSLEDGRLVLCKQEAQKVKAIFNLFTENQCLSEVVRELNRRRWARKTWTTKAGKKRGGKPFDRNSLYNLLRNPVYNGKVTLKGEAYKGQHPAIVTSKVFNKVQRILRLNGRAGGNRNHSNALLRGLLHCAPCGCLMTPTSSKKKNKAYRYYTCASARRGNWKSCPSPSLPAGEIEKYVIKEIRHIGRDEKLRRAVIRELKSQGKKRRQALQREKRSLDRQQVRHSRSLQKLAGEGKTERLDAVLAKVRATEARLKEIAGELEALKASRVDEEAVGKLLAEFDQVWAALTPEEQGRVLRLLIERVDYDGKEGKISISFLPTGLESLSQQIGEEAA